MKTKILVCLATAAVVPLLMASSCESGQDAPIATRNTGSAEVLNFPDGFRNVAHKCDGPNMVYSASAGDDTKSGSISVVPNDPRCTGAAK